MAHVTTQDVLSEAVVEARGTGSAPRARVNAQRVAEFYDMRPGEVVEKVPFAKLGRCATSGGASVTRG